ncbi:MAG TPA: hypothetical protein VFK85_08305 [Anaeromyxobacteraceae bacterium]|nr:hypothetical protein [Anaeromyxobacteraceae bacterium]
MKRDDRREPPRHIPDDALGSIAGGVFLHFGWWRKVPPAAPSPLPMPYPNVG